MQAATLNFQAVAPQSGGCCRPQARCQAAVQCPRAPCVAPRPAAGKQACQRNVAAHAKGAIKPMEATFTEFKLIDKSQKVR